MSKIVSSREASIAIIGEVLQLESFPHTEIHVNGVIDIIDQISDYYEEGRKLYPEVLLATSLDMICS